MLKLTDLHTNLKLITAFFALLSLFYMSTPVPKSWQRTLSRYINLSVYGIPCPLTLISVGKGTLTYMVSVFFKLIVKPTWLLNMLSQSVFSWMCCQVWDNRAKSSAKSRSWSVEKGVHLLLIFYCATKNPIDSNIESHRRHGTSLPYTGFKFKT